MPRQEITLRILHWGYVLQAGHCSTESTSDLNALSTQSKVHYEVPFEETTTS